MEAAGLSGNFQGSSPGVRVERRAEDGGGVHVAMKYINKDAQHHLYIQTCIFTASVTTHSKL